MDIEDSASIIIYLQRKNLLEIMRCAKATLLPLPHHPSFPELALPEFMYHIMIRAASLCSCLKNANSAYNICVKPSWI